MANKIPRVPVREQDPAIRATNFEEVCYGYDRRRLFSKPRAACAARSPAAWRRARGDQHPGVHRGAARGQGAGRRPTSSPRTVRCPRSAGVSARRRRSARFVHPRHQGRTGGHRKLERFVGDWKPARRRAESYGSRNGRKVAVIGRPRRTGLRQRLAAWVRWKIFEALHEAGGVLVYGIPGSACRSSGSWPAKSRGEGLGVEIETDVIVGRTVTIGSLLDEEGYDAVFIGSGAGASALHGHSGREPSTRGLGQRILTRANLMHAYDSEYDTPIYVGQRVVVVGGGNVAMDAVRTAKRLGAEATIVYRRSEKSSPARVEEVHHARGGHLLSGC